jgi:hypothetical protein
MVLVATRDPAERFNRLNNAIFCPCAGPVPRERPLLVRSGAAFERVQLANAVGTRTGRCGGEGGGGDFHPRALEFGLSCSDEC